MRRAAGLLALLVSVFVLSYACADTMTRARADTDKLVVDPETPNATRVETRISSRLTDDDDIWVYVNPASHRISVPQGKVIIIWADGNKVSVVGNDWVPQPVVDDMLYRTQNVNRNPIDTVMGVIALIHDYQAQHTKPEPPPPPAPPPDTSAFPTPPSASHTPEEPLNWWIWGPVIGFSVLFVIWFPLHIRLMRRRKRLLHDAEEQADWGLDKYGIKTSLDL